MTFRDSCIVIREKLATSWTVVAAFLIYILDPLPERQICPFPNCHLAFSNCIQCPFPARQISPIPISQSSSWFVIYGAAVCFAPLTSIRRQQSHVASPFCFLLCFEISFVVHWIAFLSGAQRNQSACRFRFREHLNAVVNVCTGNLHSCCIFISSLSF